MTLIPMKFIEDIPIAELRRICRRLANSVINNDSRAADKEIIKLMMEIDMAGKKIKLREEGKYEEADKIEKEQNKASRDEEPKPESSLILPK